LDYEHKATHSHKTKVWEKMHSTRILALVKPSRHGFLSSLSSRYRSSEILLGGKFSTVADPKEESCPDDKQKGKRKVPSVRTAKEDTAEDLPLSFAVISRAAVSIRGGVKRTTCEKSHFLSELVGANIYFKNEFRQFTGSFKERGARNAILQLMRNKKDLKGVIAASAGNQ